VVAEGARATGTVVTAQEKRRMGRAGKLDFSVDRIRAVNGEWLPVRYTLTKKAGDSKAVSTGVITAGVAVAFWPAAPVAAELASVRVNSNQAGADIEVKGSFVGNAPTTLKLAPGRYSITVRKGMQVWQRNLQVTPGLITLNPSFESVAVPVAQRRR
jgi:PEGA domain